MQLAMSMAINDSADTPAIARWLEIARSDPLPESRFTQHPNPNLTTPLDNNENDETAT